MLEHPPGLFVNWAGVVLFEACSPANADSAEACCRSPATADALSTSTASTAGCSVASCTTIEEDPEAGSDGGGPMQGRLHQGEQHLAICQLSFVVGGSAQQFCMESPVASLPLCIGRACIRKGRTQSNQATGTEKSSAHFLLMPRQCSGTICGPSVRQHAD